MMELGMPMEVLEPFKLLRTIEPTSMRKWTGSTKIQHPYQLLCGDHQHVVEVTEALGPLVLEGHNILMLLLRLF